MQIENLNIHPIFKNALDNLIPEEIASMVADVEVSQVLEQNPQSRYLSLKIHLSPINDIIDEKCLIDLSLDEVGNITTRRMRAMGTCGNTTYIDKLVNEESHPPFYLAIRNRQPIRKPDRKESFLVMSFYDERMPAELKFHRDDPFVSTVISVAHHMPINWGWEIGNKRAIYNPGFSWNPIKGVRTIAYDRYFEWMGNNPQEVEFPNFLKIYFQEHAGLINMGLGDTLTETTAQLIVDTHLDLLRWYEALSGRGKSWLDFLKILPIDYSVTKII